MSIAIGLEEWQKTSFDTHPQLQGAKLPEDKTTQRLALELSGQSPGKPQRLVIGQLHQGLSLEATSFVGRLSLGELRITIQPKIKMLPLLHLLQYAYSLRNLDRFDPAAFAVEALTFQDLLIYQLEQEARELVSRGLHRTYVRREEPLSAPRGRLSIQSLARQGGVIQAALPCVYYPRLEDGVLNQVLLAGIRLGIERTNSEGLRTQLQRLAHFHFAEISSIRLNPTLLKRARRTMSRLTAMYAPVLTLIELLLDALGVSLAGEGQKLALPGFLFDMNRFFQELLQRFLKDYLLDYEVLPQYEFTDMFSYRENPRRKKPPELRPDYVIKQGGRVVAILDAKYRDLWERDLPPYMLYQLVMYSLSQAGCNQATILYPTTQAQAREASIEVRLPGLRYSSVTLRPVDLVRLEKLVTRDPKRSQWECEDFAHWLAFGNPRQNLS
jgi:5-methylcytosine-specific restriction enzyme subunit McrC